MKGFFRSIKFFSQALLLIVLLIFGWVFINAQNLIKGKKSADKSNTSDLLGPDWARADVAGGGGKGVTTPFLAYYNGQEYKLENDFMFGRPKSYWPVYDVAKAMYEDGRISPDLYKITAPSKTHGERLRFQIQEIELEESFFKWIELKRIIHPQNTEVIVDSEYKKFYMLHQKSFLQNLILPKSVKQNGVDLTGRVSDKNLALETKTSEGDGIRMETSGSITVTFEDLKQGEVPYLVIKSWFRDWVLGLEDKGVYLEKYMPFSMWRSGSLVRSLVFLPLLVFGAWYLGRKGFPTEAALGAPFIFGTQGTCSFVYEYKDAEGKYNHFAISEPRAWHYNTEVIEMPMESVMPDGRVEIKISSSKRHVIGFIGLLQGIKNLDTPPYREEKIKLVQATHNRLQKDVSSALQDRTGEYVHTIPGDTIDLEFESPPTALAAREKETYLMRASGFYTSLRPESEKMAGNWRERISEEAKQRLPSLVGLKEYA